MRVREVRGSVEIDRWIERERGYRERDRKRKARAKERERES